MGVRHDNKQRELRPDQCRCRRCAAPILISTAQRHRGKCTPCSEVPRWAYVFGMMSRNTVWMVASVTLGLIVFHLWTLVDWIRRWQETFMVHPVLYSMVSLIILGSMGLLVWILKSRPERRSRDLGSSGDSMTGTVDGD